MARRTFPFDPFQKGLYTPADLLAEFSPSDHHSYQLTFDFRVFRDYVANGEYAPRDYFVSMMRALHDNSISQATGDMLENATRVIAVMGGHKMPRDTEAYRQVVTISRRLAAQGALVTSGGGPGAMEAAHLGALLADEPDGAVDDALKKLSPAPILPATKGIVKADGSVDLALVEAVHEWYSPAIEISRSITPTRSSLAVPTWHYGHEPPTPFATHIAKYFQNSIREEGLLALAKHGIVFSEGTAGTLQEIFQDAAQNYYESFGWFSPMVLLGTDYWTTRFPAVPVLESLFGTDKFSRFVRVTDSIDECIDFLLSFTPPAPAGSSRRPRAASTSVSAGRKPGTSEWLEMRPTPTASMPTRRAPARASLALALLVAALHAAPATAKPAPTPDRGPGPYSGGPTHYFTASNGVEIALSVVLPHGYEKGERYPTIFEMAGYENGSASPDGRTMLGQTKDFMCAHSPDPQQCHDFQDPPLADDTHEGTSAFRYDDDYVSVHANLPGTGCSSGEFSLYNRAHAKAGAEIIDKWIPKQEWSNGKVGILGHSFSGATGVLIASHRPKHLVAMTVSGLVDDNYRGITFPGGVLNSLFPPLWYLGIRNGYHIAGGSAQGIARNIDNDNGPRCAANTATHTIDMENDPIVNGAMSQGLDSEYWRRVSLITYIDKIKVPIHITGTWNDEQTGARGTAHLWEEIDRVPKRLLQSNGNHDTNVDAYETWADRKAWMDHWMRGITPAPEWGMTTADGTIRQSSVRTLFELHPNDKGELVSNGHHDATGYPLDGTRWSTFYMCAGKELSPNRSECEEGSDSYLSGTRRQSWLFQAGSDLGPPITSEDGPDQILLRGPVVKEGSEWAIAGPIVADLNLSVTGNNTDLFVQVADYDTKSREIAFLTRGWLKASHRAIDAKRSDYSDVDPSNPNFMYRPYRPHDEQQNFTPNEPVYYRVEVWPTAHVFRPGHQPVVIVTAPPAVDSNYSFATQSNQPASINTLIYNDAKHPSSITLPVIPLGDIDGLGATGPGCGDYWQVRCAQLRG